MRIFFITHTYSIGGSGGGEQFVSSFLQEMRKRGHEIFVFTPGGKQFLQQERKLGLQVYHCPTLGHHAFHKFEYLWLAWKAASLAKRFKPDVIHAQNDVFPAIIGSMVKRRVKKPLVVAVEYLSDRAVSLNLKLVFALNKLMLPKINYDALVSWSNFVVKNFFLPWKIEKSKIHIIPGGVNTAAFAAGSKPHPKVAKFGKNLIVSAKPLHRTNAMGISYIIRAMKIVKEKHPDWKYVVVGEGEAKEWLEDLVKELGLEKNVFLIGPLPAGEIPAVYSAAQIVAHSFAFKATTSIALIESMAAGKAIVTTDSGEVKPTVAGTALLPRAKSPESIAAAINRLIGSSALRRQLGAKAKKRAVQNYSIEAVAGRFEKLYQMVSNQP